MFELCILATRVVQKKINPVQCQNMKTITDCKEKCTSNGSFYEKLYNCDKLLLKRPSSLSLGSALLIQNKENPVTKDLNDLKNYENLFFRVVTTSYWS